MEHTSHVLHDNCLSALRDILAGKKEPTVWVDLTVHQKTGQHIFQHVAGIKYNDGVLTFEDEDGRLYFVPDVSFWFTDAADE
jgi:hypothetical protein